MLRDQHVKDERIKIVEQNLGDEDQSLAFKSFDNEKPE